MLFCAARMDFYGFFFFRIVEGAGPDWLAFFLVLEKNNAGFV